MSDNDLDRESALRAQLTLIRERFLRRAQGELPVLHGLLARIQASDLTELVQLRTLAHRLNGGGATFDFVAISERARELESQLDVILGSSSASLIQAYDLGRLLECGAQLELEIAAATLSEPG